MLTGSFLWLTIVISSPPAKWMVTSMRVSFVFFRYGYKLDLRSLCSSIRVYLLVPVNPFWLLSIEWLRGKGDDGSSPLGIDHEFTAFLDHGLKVRGHPVDLEESVLLDGHLVAAGRAC